MNNFIWTDLSTFNLSIGKQFYQNVFGWDYHQSDENYHIAYIKNFEASGLYLMPDKFQKINMPSFWMSYIQVQNVNETVLKAKNANGIVEVVDHIDGFGKIALIRDPSGAGFTIYEGTQLNSRTTETLNTMVWNELFVSNSPMVIPFYKSIFDWKIVPDNYDRYLILNSQDEPISAIQEIDNSIKGKHEYWGVFFKVSKLEIAKRKVKENGGKISYESETFTLCLDPFQAMFHIIE